MKLYIPSCTLNFNNIFTTESISPKSFYSKRGFGNKRYYSVEANDMDDVILLYSKYPIFQIKESDLENYPIVIEIETNDYADEKFRSIKNKNGVEVYSCSDTIYLNPFHCRVYFGSYSERQGVLTKAEQSLENKFSKLYSNCFLIKQTKAKGLLQKVGDLFSSHDNETDFKWEGSFCPSEIQSVPTDRQMNDALVDRVKGFLYCYLIGANTTVSQDVAELQSVARTLRNTIVAAFNSPERQPTELQDASLLKNIKNFNDLYSKTDEAVISNKQKINNRLENNPLDLSVEQCVDLLKYSNVYSDFCTKLRLLPTFDANELWDCFEDKTTETFNHVVEKLRIAVSRVVANERLKSNKRRVDELAEVSRGYVVQIKDICHKDFYEKLIQSQVLAEYKKIVVENGVDVSLAIAYNGGRILKDIMGEKWAGSPICDYISSLLNHFQESTSFDLFAINNDVPMSFAAFCQKGDNIDRLLDYMEQCGISNSKLALGLYGATYGFASLPKTFTSQLINGDKEYYKNVYLAVYKALFGIELSDAAFPQKGNEGEYAVITSSIGNSLISRIDEIESKRSKQGKIEKAITEAARLEDEVQSPRAFMFIADNVLGTRTAAYKALKEAGFENDTNRYTPEEFRKRVMEIVAPKLPKNKKDKQTVLGKVEYIIELESKRQDEKAFLYILDNLLKPTDAAYKKIAKLVSKSAENSICSSTAWASGNENIPKMPNMQAGNILQNKDWIKETAQFISDEKNRQQYKKDIQWFVENHSVQVSNGKQGCYSEKSKDNVSVIERLERYLRRRQEPNNPNQLWLAEIYKNVPIDKIITYIQKRFNVR